MTSLACSVRPDAPCCKQRHRYGQSHRGRSDMASEPQVCVFPSGEEFFRASAEKFCEIGKRAIQEHGRYTVALSGGSTPKGLHQQLATTFASELPWDKVFFFWGDERHVPPDFPESNFRMAKDTLLSKLSIPSPNIFRMHG